MRFQNSFPDRRAFYVGIVVDGVTVIDVPIIVFRNRLGYTLQVEAPLVLEPEMLNAEVERFVLQFLRRRFRPLWTTFSKRALEPKSFNSLAGLKEIRNEEVVIDLTRDRKVLYASMEKRARYGLRKLTGCTDAELLEGTWKDRADVKITRYDGRGGVSEFISLADATDAKKAHQYNPIMRSLDFSYWNQSRLDSFVGNLLPAGMLGFYSISDGSGSPKASAMIIFAPPEMMEPSVQRWASWFAGASSGTGSRENYPLLLQWHIIGELKSVGFPFYSLGSYETENPTYGPHLFKKNFGGRIVEACQRQDRRWPFGLVLDGLEFLKNNQDRLPKPLRLYWS